MHPLSLFFNSTLVSSSWYPQTEASLLAKAPVSGTKASPTPSVLSRAVDEGEQQCWEQ